MGKEDATALLYGFLYDATAKAITSFDPMMKTRFDEVKTNPKTAGSFMVGEVAGSFALGAGVGVALKATKAVDLSAKFVSALTGQLPAAFRTVLPHAKTMAGAIKLDIAKAGLEAYLVGTAMETLNVEKFKSKLIEHGNDFEMAFKDMLHDGKRVGTASMNWGLGLGAVSKIMGFKDITRQYSEMKRLKTNWNLQLEKGGIPSVPTFESERVEEVLQIPKNISVSFRSIWRKDIHEQFIESDIGPGNLQHIFGQTLKSMSGGINTFADRVKEMGRVFTEKYKNQLIRYDNIDEIFTGVNEKIAGSAEELRPAMIAQVDKLKSWLYRNSTITKTVSDTKTVREGLKDIPIIGSKEVVESIPTRDITPDVLADFVDEVNKLRTHTMKAQTSNYGEDEILDMMAVNSRGLLVHETRGDFEKLTANRFIGGLLQKATLGQIAAGAKGTTTNALAEASKVTKGFSGSIRKSFGVSKRFLDDLTGKTKLGGATLSRYKNQLKVTKEIGKQVRAGGPVTGVPEEIGAYVPFTGVRIKPEKTASPYIFGKAFNEYGVEPEDDVMKDIEIEFNNKYGKMGGGEDTEADALLEEMGAKYEMDREPQFVDTLTSEDESVGTAEENLMDRVSGAIGRNMPQDEATAGFTEEAPTGDTVDPYTGLSEADKEYMDTTDPNSVVREGELEYAGDRDEDESVNEFERTSYPDDEIRELEEYVMKKYGIPKTK